MSLNFITETAASVVSHIKRQFGDESGVQITDTDILRWINQAQREIAMIAKVTQAVATTDVVLGTYEYQLPDMNAIEISSIRYNKRPVQTMEFPMAEHYLQENDPEHSSTGSPEWWYRWADVVYFWPTPDQDIVAGLEVFYIKSPDAVVDTSAPLGLPDKYYEALIQFCMSKAYELDEDFQASAGAKQAYNDRLGQTFEEDSNAGTMMYPKISIVDME